MFVAVNKTKINKASGCESVERGAFYTQANVRGYRGGNKILSAIYADHQACPLQ